MRRRAISVVGLMAALVLPGCGGAADYRRDDFVARLEGASAVLEESAGELQPQSEYLEIARAAQQLARKFQFRYELIEKLDPPASCVAVQKEGEEKVGEMARIGDYLPKDLTPDLQRRLPQIVEEALAEYGRLEREAEDCA